MNDPRPMTLAALAELVDGVVAGDPQTTITAACPIHDAAPGCITLADNKQRVRSLEGCVAAAVVVEVGHEFNGLPCIEVTDVHAAFAKIVAAFQRPRKASGPGVHPAAIVARSAQVDAAAKVHATAVVGEDTVIGPRAIIHAGAVVGDGCQIGADTQLFPHATLYDDVSVGERCLIHAGATLGAYGFGYTQQEGRHVLCAQLGGVEIGDDVEIGVDAAIDRGVYGPTRVGDGTKIDNLVQIGHNCQIGKHNILCSQAGIAGSTSTGDYVVMGGQAGVRDHVHIGDGAMLAAQSGVPNDVPAGARLLGAPACPERDQKLKFAAVAKLPAMRREFKQLRKTVAMLEEALLRNEEPDASDRAA